MKRVWYVLFARFACNRICWKCGRAKIVFRTLEHTILQNASLHAALLPIHMVVRFCRTVGYLKTAVRSLSHLPEPWCCDLLRFLVSFPSVPPSHPATVLRLCLLPCCPCPEVRARHYWSVGCVVWPVAALGVVPIEFPSFRPLFDSNSPHFPFFPF